jgi:hypothetical protein
VTLVRKRLLATACAVGLVAIALATTSCRATTGGSGAPGQGVTSATASATAGAAGTTASGAATSTTAGSAGASAGTATPPPATGSGSSGTGGSSASGSTSSGSRANPETNLGPNILVYFSNVASTRPPSGTVIVLGKSRFTPDLVRRMDHGILGPVSPNARLTLLVYPDGEGGKRIAIPLHVPSKITADARPRTLDVAVGDDAVRVLGPMVEPAGRGPKPRF